MEFIYDPNDSFDFKTLQLKTPTLIRDGAGGFFSKYMYTENLPLYIKTPICTTKNGFSIGKKINCELCFSYEDNEPFIRWMENLVSHTQKLLFEKREEWFQESIAEEDIEEAFINPIKPYKAGKYYLVKCGIKVENGEPNVRIYDVEQNKITMEEVGTKNIITLLEIKGIRCSMKTFQIDIEIKQIMQMKTVNIMEMNLLSGGAEGAPALGPVKKENLESFPVETPISSSIEESNIVVEQEPQPAPEPDPQLAPEPELQPAPEPVPQQPIKEEIFAPPINLEAIDEISPKDELESVDLDNLEIDEEPVQLKTENELYYKMYREAINKAKEARQAAINSYLEAKNIKTLYDLEDIDFEDEEEDDLFEEIENL